MKKEQFRIWLADTGLSKKAQSDYNSRIKRIEKEIGINIDSHYLKDRCEYLLLVFSKRGINDQMSKFHTSFPIGKYSMNSFSLAIRKYVQFCDSTYKNIK